MEIMKKSSAHSKYRCQYHIVFAPKYRRKEIYGKIKKDIGEIVFDTGVSDMVIGLNQYRKTHFDSISFNAFSRYCFGETPYFFVYYFVKYRGSL